MPQPVDVTHHLIDLIYGSLFGDCDWQDFLDHVAKTSPDGKAALHYHDLTSPVAHVPYMSGFTQKDVEQFSSHFASVNPWIPRMGLVPVGQGLFGDQIFSRERMLKTEFYNDWLKGQAGCETSVGVSVIRENSRTLILSTATSSADPDVNSEAAARYTLLAPHMRRAFDLIRKRDLIAGDDGSSLLFDSIGVGLIYVSDRRRERRSNLAAEGMMNAGFPVRRSPDGRIAIRCEATSAHLDCLLKGQVERRAWTSVVEGPGGVPTYKLTLVRIQSNRFTELLEGPTVAVIIEPMIEKRRRTRQETLMEKSRLTATEARVAISIAAGNTPREVAAEHHIGYETVRTHLRNIYLKLGVNSQVALTAFLLGG